MIKNLLKFKEICDGWKNYIFPSPEIEILAIERAKICSDCKVPTGDGRVVDGVDENNRCVKCRCYIPAKTRSVNSSCPLRKW